MPYWVEGWIEIVWDFSLEDDIQKWCGVINLNRFHFYGDDVPDLLFGLTKQPCDNPYFAKRGVPKDCSQQVADEVKRSEEFIKKYGEGNINYTYARWSEIAKHLSELEKAEDFDDWNVVFSMVQIMCEKKFKPEWIRFVVWGNW
jgi:hypothetical protein